MSFIGKIPANAALTASDLADGIITAAKIADGTIVAGELASDSVTTIKVANDAITLAKLASGTDGNVISYDASGNPVAIATGSDGQVLTSTGAGSPPAFEAVAAGGKIGQIISASKIDTQTMSSSSFVDVADLTVAITPSATSSKIFWTFTVAGGDNTNYGIAKITYGDGSDLTTTARHESAGNRIRGTSGWAYTPNAYQTATLSGQGLDSPNTTDATTYKIRIATSGTFYVNRSTTWYDNATTYAGIGSITVMEVLA